MKTKEEYYARVVENRQLVTEKKDSHPTDYMRYVQEQDRNL